MRLAAGVMSFVRTEAVLGVLLIGGGLIQRLCWFVVVGCGLLLWVAMRSVVMELVVVKLVEVKWGVVMLVVMKLVDEVVWMKKLLAVVLVWFDFVLWFHRFPVV